MKKKLDEAYKQQMKAQEEKKKEKLEELERKREEIRRETKILISSKTTETMKCPDCGKVFNNLINYVYIFIKVFW